MRGKQKLEKKQGISGSANKMVFKVLEIRIKLALVPD